MSDLIKISGCENPHRIGDVIFVHGLWGDAIETWHPQGKRDRDAKDFWPAWLGDDLPNVGIWSLDYEAEPSKWIGTTMPLFDRAKNALEMLDSYEIGDRPVIFIAHSMGGLLVKQMLRNSLEYEQPSWKKILTQTRGIIFLATPHTGADLASWIGNLGGIFRPTESVDELKANAPQLRDLNEFYINQETLRNIPMKVYYEKQKTKGVLVVDETSANPGIPRVTPIPVDYNHISICRPQKQDLIYRQVKRFIEGNFNLKKKGDYEYDVFLSYPRKSPALPWVRNYFYPLLEEWLRQSLGWSRSPEIFVDDFQIEEKGLLWSSDLQQALKNSRCMIAVLSPDYFSCNWSLSEWESMRHRQKMLRLRDPQKPWVLIYGVIFHPNREHLQEQICCLKCKKNLKAWNVDFPGFKNSPQYLDFVQAVEEICQELTKLIDNAPPYEPNWPIVRATASEEPKKIQISMLRM